MTFATNAEMYADLDLRPRHIREEEECRAAIANPEPGDYWHEMFCPYSLVIARVEGRVATFEDIVDDGPRSRTYHYDTTKVTWRSLEDFEKRMKYSTMDKFVAKVVRRSKRLQVIEDWRADGGQL